MKGTWHGEPYWDFREKKWFITFETTEKPTEYDSTKGKELSIQIKEYRKKRTLDANAYCWVLCTKLAEALGSSKEEVYEEMIQRYSVIDEDEEGYIVITLLEKIPISKLDGHWRFVKKEGRFCSYLKLKGSSEMNTKEMATLIDGIISECKEMGIETDSPREIERIKEQWGLRA